ncbi:hypothetical protein [Micromonospora sp. NPDC005237]|uniref:hypothetical protein n=1 Tax=Micromonospora sp. NPDC005237 TaxID=3155113 RepID=UPI0033B896F4
MTHGHTNAGVAQRSHVSRSAVGKHVNAIFDKLGLTRPATAAVSPLSCATSASLS